MQESLAMLDFYAIASLAPYFEQIYYNIPCLYSLILTVHSSSFKISDAPGLFQDTA